MKTTLQSLPSEREDEDEGDVLRVEELRESTSSYATEDVGANAVAVQTSIAGKYVLSLDESHSEHDVAALLAPFGARVVRQIAQRPIYLIHVPGDDRQAARASAVDEIRRLPGVVAVDPEFLFESTSPQHDPLVARQWHLKKVQALPAWAISKCDSQTVVAVIDTSIALNDPELEPNIWTNDKEKNGGPNIDDDNNGYCDDVRGWDFIEGDNDVSGNSGTHGTTVAAIIAAFGGNGLGGSGISPRGRIMPIRAVRDWEEEHPNHKLDLSWAVDALYYAINNGATIINASWGMNCFDHNDCPPKSLRIAIEEAAKRQILVVTGAGNADDVDIDLDGKAFYPASFDLPNVIAVAASDQNDQLWRGSSWGPKSVDLAAPGQDICALEPPLCEVSSSSGTSYAAAMVSGAALLVTDRFGTVSVEHLRSQILDNVQKCSTLKNKTATGGRLDVYKALCICPSWMAASVCSPCPSGSATAP